MIGFTRANGTGKPTSLPQVVSLLEARGIRIGVITDMLAELRTEDLDLVLVDLDLHAPGEIADFIVRKFVEPRTQATSADRPAHATSADPPAWLIEGRY